MNRFQAARRHMPAQFEFVLREFLRRYTSSTDGAASVRPSHFLSCYWYANDNLKFGPGSPVTNASRTQSTTKCQGGDDWVPTICSARIVSVFREEILEIELQINSSWPNVISCSLGSSFCIRLEQNRRYIGRAPVGRSHKVVQGRREGCPAGSTAS